MDVSWRNETRHNIAAVCALVLVVAACSVSTDGTTTSTAQPAPASTTTTPPTATPTTTSTTTTSTTATPSTVPPPTTAAPLDAALQFQFEIRDPDSPVLAPGDWDGRFTYSPWVVHRNGTFHMFYTGWDNDVGIGYAVADDGVGFTKVGDGPVLAWRGEIGSSTAQPNAPVVYVADDGTWVMYFSELIARRSLSSSIRRATAPAPEGPWTVDADPIFTAGDDQWDSEIVPQSVVVTTDEVLLFYDGRTGRTAETGLLRSPDGIVFTPHDDPATPRESDPVLGIPGTQAWDGAGAGSPMAIAGDGFLEMFYVGFLGPTRGDRTIRLGYAQSDDGGTSWGRLPANPVIDLSPERGSPASLGFPWMGAVKVEDVYYIYYAIAAGADGIGLITGSITEG